MSTTGIICDNTCLGFQPGDDTPDYLGLFGPVLGDLMGQPASLQVGAMGYSLTINGHTQTFGLSDPFLHISFTDPLLASFAPGSVEFTATGSTVNPYGFTNLFGFAVPEVEFICPIPGVPEPGTFMLLAAGLLLMVAWRGARIWR